MPKKSENLLNELESISTLLNDSEDNIPILQETIEDTVPRNDAFNTDKLNSSSNNTNLNTTAQKNDKNRQTTKPKDTKNTSSASRKKGDGDNPFLPQHIRTRLKEGKESFMKEQLSQPGNPYEPIIDELVTHYLPIIEKDLREKLKVMATSFASTHYDETDIGSL